MNKEIFKKGKIEMNDGLFLVVIILPVLMILLFAQLGLNFCI